MRTIETKPTNWMIDCWLWSMLDLMSSLDDRNQISQREKIKESSSRARSHTHAHTKTHEWTGDYCISRGQHNWKRVYMVLSTWFLVNLYGVHWIFAGFTRSVLFVLRFCLDVTETHFVHRSCFNFGVDFKRFATLGAQKYFSHIQESNRNDYSQALHHTDVWILYF